MFPAAIPPALEVCSESEGEGFEVDSHLARLVTSASVLSKRFFLSSSS